VYARVCERLRLYCVSLQGLTVHVLSDY
jgi:hypothetical protein